MRRRAAPTKWASKHPLLAPPHTELVNGILFFALGDGKLVRHRASVAVTPREWASHDSRPTGKDLERDAGVLMSHITKGADGKLWLVAGSGSRFPAEAFAPAA